MFVLLTISLGFLATVSIIALLWRTFSNNQKNQVKLPEFRKEFRSLFAPSEAEIKQSEAEENAKLLAEKQAKLREKLRLRIENRDFSALLIADDLNDAKFYDELLRAALGKDDFERLTEFFRHHDKLPVPEVLPEKLRLIWQAKPTRRATIDFLHFAARTNSAQIFLETIEVITKNRRDNESTSFSDEDLILLLEGEFQTLSTDEKSSGAGFLVKQKISALKSDL